MIDVTPSFVNIYYSLWFTNGTHEVHHTSEKNRSWLEHDDDRARNDNRWFSRKSVKGRNREINNRHGGSASSAATRSCSKLLIDIVQLWIIKNKRCVALQICWRWQLVPFSDIASYFDITWRKQLAPSNVSFTSQCVQICSKSWSLQGYVFEQYEVRQCKTSITGNFTEIRLCRVLTFRICKQFYAGLAFIYGIMVVCRILLRQ